MSRVRAAIELPGSVYEAETCWYEISRRPRWVDELSRVVEVEGGWPQVGSVLVWESGPAGRGRVRERVTRYEPRAGQELAVEDDSITGTQRVAFSPTSEGVEVELTLDYRIKRRSPLTPLVDAVFVRRPMTASLARTLVQFGAVLDASRHEAFE